MEHLSYRCAILILMFGCALSSGGQTPSSAEELVNLGKAEMDKGNMDDAMADFTKAISIDPKYAMAYHGRGTILLQKGDFDAAIADYNRALELAPRFANSYRNRGTARWLKGDLDGAL